MREARAQAIAPVRVDAPSLRGAGAVHIEGPDDVVVVVSRESAPAVAPIARCALPCTTALPPGEYVLSGAQGADGPWWAARVRLAHRGNWVDVRGYSLSRRVGGIALASFGGFMTLGAPIGVFLVSAGASRPGTDLVTFGVSSIASAVLAGVPSLVRGIVLARSGLPGVVATCQYVPLAMNLALRVGPAVGRGFVGVTGAWFETTAVQIRIVRCSAMNRRGAFSTRFTRGFREDTCRALGARTGAGRNSVRE